jgi:DNA-directed RNA polymerase specialized sigma subunit
MKTLPPKIQDNLITILEAARIALGDADTYEYIADELDLSDEALIEIRESVQSYLAEDYKEGWAETHPNDPLDTATAVSCLNDKTPPRFDLLPLLYTALDALVEHGDETTEPWIRKQLTLLNK